MVKLAADIVIPNKKGEILLIKRDVTPFKGKWVLPGGKMKKDEKIEKTAKREAKEETNLDIEIEKLLGVYSEPGRDPRGRYVSIAYITKEKDKKEAEKKLKTNYEANETKWKKPVEIEKEETGFDHDKIVKDYIKKKKHPKKGKNKQNK